jgi:hypothetical protein
MGRVRMVAMSGIWGGRSSFYEPVFWPLAVNTGRAEQLNERFVVSCRLRKATLVNAD